MPNSQYKAIARYRHRTHQISRATQGQDTRCCYNLHRMTPVPFDLPLRPSEAGALAALIFEHAERKPLKEDLRNRIAGRAAAVKFESLAPYLGSLERDPVHPSSYYVAVDAATPLLLHIAAASAPTGSLYPKALLIGRMRPSRGREIVIN